MLSIRIAALESPIESAMAEAMVIAFAHFAAKPETLTLRSQVSIGHYRADFTIEAGDVRLIVECDGKEFHDAKKDAERDARLLERGWITLRFTGSAIHRSAVACADEVVASVYEWLALREQKRDEDQCALGDCTNVGTGTLIWGDGGVWACEMCARTMLGKRPGDSSWHPEWHPEAAE